MDDALRVAARIGPYFVWEPFDGDPEFRPITELSDPDRLTARVGAARDMLARMGGLPREDLSERVVASTVFLGLAARLVSAPLAAAVVGGAIPLVTGPRVLWRPADSGLMPVAYRNVGFEGCAGSEAGAIAAALTGTVVNDLVKPLLSAFRERFVLSPQVLWGNVASALGGALTMISTERAAAVVGAMLTQGSLAGTATLMRPDPSRERWLLARNNCCLYYRIPGGGTCGDCVLKTR
ncbi:(2Fe-2S)-binding protein [Actinoplanes sp. CA-015351]|uniref:(2Fe-2S)-binding protein n=1 Tax=Actinoplanes sp. CA-015351 TaxID=3239897 RepID=UPI003D9845DC